MKSLKIAIAGLGVSGSVLSSIIGDYHDVDLYEVRGDDFYPACGWAVNENEFIRLGNDLGIDPEKYVLSRSRMVTFINSRRKVKFSSSGLCTIDKKHFLIDLSTGRRKKSGQIDSSEYDLVFDCTGISRYYVGSVKDDFVMPALEIVSNDKCEDFTFRYFRHGSGYEWFFPLKDGSHHGVGSDSREEISKLLENRGSMRLVGRSIRLKPLFDYSVKDNIIAVGESAGTVSPLTGEGIVPSMKCAILARSILSDGAHFNGKYPDLLKRYFSRYERLFSLLMMARNDSLLKIRNIRYLKDVIDDFRNFGIDMSLPGVIRAIA
ncbi:MAG: hypothetical protein M1605_02525 [Candidatus Thermoplasmatota archaeon]|nr:hypothetical protein [Candidatus Thermoplasmatota archaeon]